MAGFFLLLAAIFIGIFFAWKSFCIIKRNQRAKLLASLDPVKDARRIIWFMYAVEFPFLSQKALEFGTIQTLGIPSITKLLYRTKYGLIDPEKRAAETNILVSEIIHHHPDSERGSYAVQRLNGIHAQFRIPNDEFVYVLCLNVVKPIDFSAKFGFRDWTENEKLAAHTLWHDVGVRMGIKNIPEGIPQMRQFIEDFEEKYAVFHEKNKAIVQDLKFLVLNSFPRWLQPIVEYGICALTSDRIRVATGLRRPPLIIEWIILAMFRIFAGSFVSMFLPPRSVEAAKGSIQVDWCPNPAANPDVLRPLNVNVYKPPSFEKGYKLAELGALKPGRLGPKHEGALLCPFHM